MDTEEIKQLLGRYRQGTCTEAEAQLIEAWLASIAGDEDYSDEFIGQQLFATKNQIDEQIGVIPGVDHRRNYWWVGVAASLLLFGASVAIITVYNRKQPAQQLASQTGISRYVSNGWVFVQTQKGVTDHEKLPDGSVITIDASTTIRYPEKFVNHKRPIYLDEGEALFEVAKDKSSPFTVYTPKFATTALGTAFNIRSYARENKVSISLLHGKIKVEDLHPANRSTALRILLPHQQVVLNKRSGVLVKNNFSDETPITSWTAGVLTFSDATMDEVLNAIENHYNVTIKNNSGRTDWSYTGTFKGQSLNDVLKTVCLTEGITSYNIINNNVTLN